MSDSAKSTRNTARTISRSITTNKALQERLNAVETALTESQRISPNREGEEGNQSQPDITSWQVKFLAEGGYNYVWLVIYVAKHHDEKEDELLVHRKVVIREPNQDASPYQIENEVAFITYLSKHHPSIPVPKVYAYSTKHSGLNSPYIAMEYIEGQSLESMWGTLSEPEKNTIVDEVAQIIVELGDINLDGIGGLTLNHALGPTVEGVKLFRGRDQFHSTANYDIGPYTSTHAYVLACYDKDIYYYTHASDCTIGEDVFTSPAHKSAYIASLQSARNDLANDPTLFLPQEPFALVHGDFCGRNIMIHNGHVRAIIDWEFAGSYPLSELLGGMGVELFELEDANLEEFGVWSERIRGLVGEKARGRGWAEERVELLLGDGCVELQCARREMLPLDDWEDEEESDGKGKGKGERREVRR